MQRDTAYHGHGKNKTIKTMRILFIPLITCLFFVGSCSKTNDASSPEESSLTARAGGSERGIQITLGTCYNTIIETDSIRVCFDEVLVDCRCPKKVTCVWAGYAEVQLTITVNGTTETHALSTLGPNSTVISGYEFTFVDLLPYPVYGVTPAPGTIKAVVTITKV